MRTAFWLGFLAAFVAAGITPGHAWAEVVTVCGESQGRAYFFENPVTRGDAGWTNDGISGGGILLIVDGDKVDIVSTDSSGGTRSSRADGAVPFVVGGAADGFLLVILPYPGFGTVDHFLFSLDPNGNGEVLWGTSRGGGLFQKSSLMRAKCRGP